MVRGDKCASGVGISLRMASNVLGIKVEDMSQMARNSEEEVVITSTCSVFAESEIISNIHRGFPLENICAGICESVMQRMLDVLRRVETHKDVVLCGGVAKNRTIVKMFDAELGFPVLVPEDPVIVGALGAALIAETTVKG